VPNSILAGALLQTPLGQLTELPTPSAPPDLLAGFKGPSSKKDEVRRR